MNPEEINKLLEEIDKAITALWAIEDTLNAQLLLAVKKEQEDDQIPLL